MSNYAQTYSLPEVEYAINGILIKESELNECTAEILETTKPDHFSMNLDRTIFNCISELAAKGDRFDLINLDTYMQKKLGHDYDAIGLAGLAERADLTPSKANAMAYVKSLLEAHSARDFLGKLNSAYEVMSENGCTTDKLNNAVSILSTMEVEASTSGVAHIKDSLSDFIDTLEQSFKGGGLVGKQTGFEGLDDAIGGLEDGNLVIIAGKPGSGKTTFALNIMRHFFMNKLKVEFYSLEMTKKELNQKLCSDIGNVLLNEIRSGNALSDDLSATKISQYLSTMSEVDFYVDDTAGLHINQIVNRCRKNKIKNGKPDLIVVDYIQIVKGDGEQRYLQVANVSSALKALAKEMQCPVIALSQLKKETHGRPKKEDLRESGQIEQDADLIFFLHTDNDDNVPMKDQLTELIVAKARMGGGGMIPLNNQLSRQRFTCAGGSQEIPTEEKSDNFF